MGKSHALAARKNPHTFRRAAINVRLIGTPEWGVRIIKAIQMISFEVLKLHSLLVPVRGECLWLCGRLFIQRRKFEDPCGQVNLTDEVASRGENQIS